MSVTQKDASSDQEFIATAVEVLASALKKHIAQSGQVLLGLSGGTTPGAVYEALGMQSDIDWTKVTIFLVDDRYVLASFPDSNQRLVEETLLKKADITEDRIIFPDVRLPLEQAVEDYSEHIETLISEGVPCVTVLGLGHDGHIGSLFPPVPEEAFDGAYAMHTQSPVTSSGDTVFAVLERIAVTLPALCSAADTVVLLKGPKKKKVFTELMQSNEDATRWPLKAVMESSDTTVVTLW